VAQPLTYSAVYIRPGSANGGIIGANNAFAYIGGGSANTVQFNAGGTPQATAADNVWHGVQGFFSGASSFGNVDGTETATATTGTNGLSASSIQFGRCKALELTGSIAEGGLYSAAATNAAQRGALFANQNSNYGYSGKL